MVSGEVESGGGRRCHRIYLIGGRGETCLYKSVCPPEMRGRHTLTESEAETKMVVVTNSEELKRREDK